MILSWIKETYNAEVIACCVNVGQDKEVVGLKEKARRTGASKCYVIDAKKEFVTDYIFPAIKANALYENRYLLGTSLARPVIAKKIVEIAKKEKADAICHGATGKGNDQVRFELGFKALMPEAKIIAPWRIWDIKSRNDAIDYAKKRGIPVPVTKAKPYSSDANLWHISYEGGVLEDTENEWDEDMFQMTVSAKDAPNKATYVKIDFVKGVPVAINGKTFDPVSLVQKLNDVAGANGIGRIDIIENRLVGMKSRGVYEAPAATLLYFAHNELESMTIDRDTAHYKELIAHKYAELAYNGLWFNPLREALDAFIDVTQKYVTGSVTVKLYKGNMQVVSRKAKNPLYWEELATFDKDEIYNQKDAEGFINLFGLPTKVQALMRKGK
ncbi:MAG: argininosuccinate synthase [Elusimicrobia bacterium]|nr:argininosuccinate synthase [Elusimicrobiota bacterium]